MENNRKSKIEGHRRVSDGIDLSVGSDFIYKAL